MDTLVPPAPGPPAPASASPPDAVDAVDAEARTAGVLVALLAWTIPLATGYAVWAAPGGADDWNRRVSVAPFDLVLVAIVGWTLLRRELVVELFRARAVQVASGLFAVAFLVSLALGASPLGVTLGLRLLAGLAVIAVVGRATSNPAARRLALGAIAAAGSAQAVLAMVQAARGTAFGIELIDFAGPLYPFGGSFAGRGGLTHPYHLAVFLLVAQGAALLGLRHAGPARAARAPWLAALVLLGAGIGITYTRAGAIGQIALVGCLLLGRADRRVLRAAAAAVVLGLGIGGLGFGDGWLARGETSIGDDANATSSRNVRLAEAGELIEEHPLTGVGPGRYVEALAEEDRTEYLPAHNLLAHQAAELGVIGGVAVTALLALLALRAWRGGAWTAAVVVPMVPFLLLDAYPYVFATGLAASAIWLGLVRTSLAGEP